VSFPAKTSYFHTWRQHVIFTRKRSPSLWLRNKSRLWKQADLVFHWCLYNQHNITYSLMDMNFIPYVINIMLFEQVCRQCSRRILTSPVIYQLKYARQQVIFQKWHPSASCHAPLGLRFRYYCKKINCFCRSLVLAFWRVRINDILGPVSRKSRKFFGPKSHS